MQVCLAHDFLRPELQERYGSHFMPSILAHTLPGSPPVALDDSRADDPKLGFVQSGLCGVVPIARDYCPIF